jgi:hypothetical protein
MCFYDREGETMSDLFFYRYFNFDESLLRMPMMPNESHIRPWTVFPSGNIFALPQLFMNYYEEEVVPQPHYFIFDAS